MPSRAVTHHDNLDDVVDEHAQLSAPPPTIHRPHVRSFPSSGAYTSSVYTDDWYSRSLQPAVVSEGSTSVSMASRSGHTKSEITGYVVRAFEPGLPPTSKLTRRFLFPNRIEYSEPRNIS